MHAKPTIDPRFELVDELGRGGMGIVYRARDLERGGEVALKSLREARAQELLRLKNEFRVMCNVRHPNLVRLGELVERDGGWFFTMELVEGVDLLEWVGATMTNAEPRSDADTSSVTTAEPVAARMVAKLAADDADIQIRRERRATARTRPAPPQVRPAPRFNEARLRSALRGLADGLAGLHRAGLVHRDVKPSNIKIDAHGRVVLLDFGVATVVDDTDREVAGTYAYMAPEQATGQATAMADWYAVGVMLFRAMTGQLPFPPTRDGLELKATEQAPSPDAFVRDLPRDLVGLCAKLLRADPSARAGEADVRAVTGLQLPLRAAPTATSVPFIGRKRECAQLASLRARQLREQSCLAALILGPSGVGKTALVRRVIDEHLAAHANTILLESRCDERETLPFNAIDGLVDGLARLVSRQRDRLPPAALEALRGRDAAELRRLFPVLAELAPPVATRRLQLSHEDSRAAATRVLREVLEAIGRATPLVILIDDAQWADADSGVLLGELLASPAPPLLLVVTARGESKPALLAGVSVPIDEIALAGLEPADAIALATAVANKPIDAAAIAREAGGHPMFVAELSRFAAERRGAAGSLDDALWARASDMPSTARRLLEVVVTDGAQLSRSIAIEASGLSPAEAADAIAELRAARLIRAGDDTVEPYHDRVREALAGRLPRAERAALHLVLAHALADSGAPPERLAHHWQGAGELERAATAAEAAATRAAEALAFERVAEWLAMALGLGTHSGPRRRELLIARADALTHAGHPRDAGLAFLEASRTGEPGELEHRDLRRRAAERLLVGGYAVEGLEVARELLAEIDLPYPKSRGAAFRSLLTQHMRIGFSRLRWRSRAEAELTDDQKLRLDTCWSAALGLSMIDPIRGTMFVFRALRMSLAAGEPRRIALTLGGAAFAAAGMNQDRRLRRLARAIERAAGETNAPEARCYVALADAARAYFFTNDWPGTREIAQRGLEVWSEAGRGHTWEVDLFQQFIGWAHGTAGDYRVAADHAERVLRGARRRGDHFIEVGFRVQFPQRYLLDDRPADGMRDIDDALASWPLPDGLETVSNQFYWAWRGRVMLALYAGRAEADAAVIEEGWRRIAGSLLWQVPAVRLDVTVWAGAWLVARAAEARKANASTFRAHLAGARRAAKVIAASPLPARVSSVHSFRGIIAHLEGNADKAVAEMRESVTQLDAYNMIGPAMAARWQLGRMLGGDEGAALIDQARAWYRKIDAAKPELIVASSMPGVEP